MSRRSLGQPKSQHTHPTDDKEASSGMLDASVGHTKRSIKHRVKDLFEEAFPQAIRDIKILGGLTALETVVKGEMDDLKLSLEVRIESLPWYAVLLSIYFEEQAFRAKREARARDRFAKYLDLKLEDIHRENVPRNRLVVVLAAPALWLGARLLG